MKKRFTIILSILTAISLCGCDVKEPDSSGDSTVNNSSSEGSTTTENSTTTESSDSSAENSGQESGSGKPLVLVGPDGKAVPEENYLEIRDVWGETVSLSEINADDWNSVNVKGMYVSMPSKVCRTSADDPDVFDSENISFKDVPEQRKSDFILVNEGDKICGLTVKTAESTFLSQYFFGGYIELEGTVELTGYIMIQPEDEYGTLAGEIRFIPSDCEVDLPVVAMEYDYTNFYHTAGQIYMMSGIYYTNEYGQFRLGLVKDTTVDLSGVPKDGSCAKVKITIENLSMTGNWELGDRISATLTDLTIL